MTLSCACVSSILWEIMKRVPHSPRAQQVLWGQPVGPKELLSGKLVHSVVRKLEACDLIAQRKFLIDLQIRFCMKEQVLKLNHQQSFNILSCLRVYITQYHIFSDISSIMEHDTKNKHRISDARWRDSVARCYNLLKHCSFAEQESTRMSILRLTLEQIESIERQIAELGFLDNVKQVFGRGEFEGRK